MEVMRRAVGVPPCLLGPSLCGRGGDGWWAFHRVVSGLLCTKGAARWPTGAAAAVAVLVVVISQAFGQLGAAGCTGVGCERRWWSWQGTYLEGRDTTAGGDVAVFANGGVFWW